MSDGTTAYEFNGTLGDVDRIVRKLVRLYGLDAAACYGFTYPHCDDIEGGRFAGRLASMALDILAAP